MAFSVHESSASLDAAAVGALLNDELALCVFRGVVNRAQCAALADAFGSAPEVRSRADQVPGRTLGTIHFLKSVPQYLQDSARAATELAAFFATRVNPLDAALRQLGEQFQADGRLLRQGGHDGQAFCPMVMRSWDGDGDFSLLPHEDVSQLGHPAQAALEFARARPTVGNINVCLDNFADPGHGALRMWNFAPDAGERQRLGIDSSGYPYPLHALAGRTWFQTPIFAGDVYVINGKYVHAVTGGAAGGRRVTLAAMLALVDETNCVHWA